MNKPMIRIHNAETNEVVDREMTDQEYLEYQELQSKLEQEAQAEEEKAAAKASVLNRIGITEEEARLLLL